MRLPVLYAAAILLLIGLPRAAQPEAAVDEESEVDVLGAELELTSVGLPKEVPNLAGGPLKRLAAKWPDDLVIAPVPGYSPQLGWNLVLGGGYFIGEREEGSETPPSVIGGFVMGAENGSVAYGGGASLHLLEDKLRIKFGAGYADIRYRYYGVFEELGNDLLRLDLEQEGPLYFASGSWRVWKELYLGLGYLRGNVETRPRLDLPDFPNFPDFEPSIRLDVGAYTIPIEIDSRDHEQFPRDGWLIQAKGILYRESAGSDFDADIFKVAANRYLPMREKDVLASRIVVRSTSGDAPFFLLSTFGGSKDLRGYPSGRYRDRMMYAVQSEYRWQFNDRWVFTGFAGFGEVADTFGDFGDDFLPAAGVGARFVLSKKHRVGLALDVATGKDGTEFYFGVGEAF